MKRSLTFFLLLLATAGSLNAQTAEKNDEKLIVPPISQEKNLICDSLFNLYTNYWKEWWHKLKIRGPIPGETPPAHFSILYNDLLLLDSLGRKGNIPDSLQLFYAFTSDQERETNQITAIFLLKDSADFKRSTERWKIWAKVHIKGEQPVGFKIRYDDLQAMYELLKDPKDPMNSLTAYFAFHSSQDRDLNRISIVFRPGFKGKQKKVKNDEINCGQTTIRTGHRITGISYINIDFTNPCPPCYNKGKSK